MPADSNTPEWHPPLGADVPSQAGGSAGPLPPAPTTDQAPPPAPPQAPAPPPTPQPGQTQPTTPLPSFTGPAPYSPPAAGPAQYGQGPAQFGQGPAQYGQGPAPAPPRQPMKRSTKRALIGSLVGAGVLALLIGGAAIALSIMNESRDPAAKVEEYLALIADGKAEAANAMVDPGLSKRDSVLLTDEVLAAATERIEVLGVETTRRGGDGARVVAELKLDGERFEHVFSVQSGPKEWLLLDTWVLDDPLVVRATIESYSGNDTALVGGQPVQLASDDEDAFFAEIHVYPGVYTVEGPQSRFLDASQEVLTALSPDEGAPWVEVGAEPNEEFEAEILAQAMAAAQACVTVPSNMNAECPSIVQSTTLSTMTITEPATELDYLSMTEFETGWMTIGVRSTSASASSSLRTEDVYIRGSVEWDEEGNPRIVDYEFL